MFWGMYITLDLITKQIIYCVKGDIFKMLTIYIQLYFMAGEDSGNPLQYSCLESAMDRGAW